MPGAKVIVLYPAPRDQNTFERAYTQDHVPMVTPQNFKGIQKFVASRAVGTADGSAPPFYRIAELHFPSMEVAKGSCGIFVSAKGGRARYLDLKWRSTYCPRRRGRDEDLLACRLTRACSGLVRRLRLLTRR